MIYVSVVSHGHLDLIDEIGSVYRLSRCKDIVVVIYDNKSRVKINSYFNKSDIHLIASGFSAGFAENNNKVFDYCRALGMNNSDMFLIMNPDVDVSVDAVKECENGLVRSGNKIGTIKLFVDKDYSVTDDNVRNFPRLVDFVSSFLFRRSRSIIKTKDINDRIMVDWAAGSFIMSEASIYGGVGGLDESYFMYCEDIDYCMKCFVNYGCRIYFLGDIDGVHYTAKASRRIFSRYFIWHVCSVIRYLLKWR